MPLLEQTPHKPLSDFQLMRSRKFKMEPVRLFESGTHKGILYTNEDIDAVVSNFNAFSLRPSAQLEVPLVLGHEQAQILLEMTGHPSAGWVREVWADFEPIEEPYLDQSGVSKWRQRVAYFLYGVMGGVPEEVAQWIIDDEYRYLSCEFSRSGKPPPGVDAVGPMLMRVAILGATQPYLKSIGPLPRPEPDDEDWFADTDRSTKSVVTLLLPMRGVKTFSEDPTMNEALYNALTAAGVAPEIAQAIAQMDPSQYPAVAQAISGASGGTNNPPADGFSRDAAIEKLASQPGADRASLAKMSDDELKCAFAKLPHDAGDIPGNTVKTAKPGENDPANPQNAAKSVVFSYSADGEVSINGVKLEGVKKVTAPKVDTNAVSRDEFSAVQKKNKEMEEGFRKMEEYRKSEQARQTEAAKQQRAERRKVAMEDVDSFCQQMVTDRRLTPALAETHARSMKLIIDAPNFDTAIVKFSVEGKELSGNLLDRYKAELKSMPVMKFSQEKIVPGTKPKPGESTGAGKAAMAKSSLGREFLAARERMATGTTNKKVAGAA